jgi:hypothetical protein
MWTLSRARDKVVLTFGALGYRGKYKEIKPLKYGNNNQTNKEKKWEKNNKSN